MNLLFSLDFILRSDIINVSKEKEKGNKMELMNFLNNLSEEDYNVAIVVLSDAISQWGFEYEDRRPHAALCEEMRQLLDKMERSISNN